MRVSNSAPEVHLSRLEPIMSGSVRKERSRLMFSGKDRLGLNCRIASYFRDHGANIRSCSERLHDIDPIFGSQYIIEALGEDMSKIDEESIRKIGDECEDPIEEKMIRHPLTFVAPDQHGMLAKIGEFLLQRKISILANDTVTFMAPFPKELGGDGSDVRMATISLLIGLQAQRYEDHFESLKDGIEYLEHRFSWYIRLDEARAAKDRSCKAIEKRNSRSEILPFLFN